MGERRKTSKIFMLLHLFQVRYYDLNHSRESIYSRIPNRHERLFFCGRGGKLLSRVMLQIFYILSIIYFATYLAFSAKEVYNSYKTSSRETLITLSVILTISPVMMILVWVLTVPLILTRFTIITNVSLVSLTYCRSR